MSKVRGTGRPSPSQSITSFRLSSMVIGRCVPEMISRDLEFLGLLRIIALGSVYDLLSSPWIRSIARPLKYISLPSIANLIADLRKMLVWSTMEYYNIRQ